MSSSLSRHLLGVLEDRLPRDSSKISMLEWICANTKLRGKKFSTKGYEFQDAIINDMHPNMDVIKPSQIGLTEVQIRKSLGILVRNNGTSLIFTLPTEEMYERVSKARIQPLVEKDKVFNGPRDRSSTRTKSMMQFGDSFLYVTPTSEGAATSIPADFIMNDEVDLSDQQMLALFNSRLQNSAWKVKQRFSTPTFHQFGIDVGFQSSDQMHYLLRCDSCNHWNHPEFDRSHIIIPGLPDWMQELTEIDTEIASGLDLHNAYVACQKCGDPLNLSDPSRRAWVPKHPSRTLSRGYRITPFATGRLGIPYMVSQLLEYKKNDYLRGFHNTVLGQPYQDGSIRLEQSMIEACMTGQETRPEPNRDRAAWLGIDVGQTCHCSIAYGDGERMDWVRFETVPVNDLIGWIAARDKEYRIVGGAIDRHPYTPTADAVFEATSGRVIPVEYRGTKEVNIVRNLHKEVTHAQADRTKMLDRVARNVRNRTSVIHDYALYRTILIEHLRDMVRDEKPEKPATWIKLTGNDHFFHSMAFAAIAPSIFEAIDLTDTSDQRSVVSVDQVSISDGMFQTASLFGVGNKMSRAASSYLGNG